MARNFNGTSDKIRVDASHLMSMTAAYSLAFWINAPSDGTASHYFFSEGSSTVANTIWGIESVGGPGAGINEVRVFLRNAAGTALINTILTTSILDSTAHAFAFAQDASGHWAAWIDSTSQTGSYTAASTFAPDRSAIGCLSRAADSNFGQGSLSEVAIWNRQLSTNEIAGLASGLPASHLAPTHYWPLFGRDSPEIDLGSGTHVTGTVTGTAFVGGGRVQPNLLVTS